MLYDAVISAVDREFMYIFAGPRGAMGPRGSPWGLHRASMNPHGSPRDLMVWCAHMPPRLGASQIVPEPIRRSGSTCPSPRCLPSCGRRRRSRRSGRTTEPDSTPWTRQSLLAVVSTGAGKPRRWRHSVREFGVRRSHGSLCALFVKPSVLHHTTTNKSSCSS